MYRNAHGRKSNRAQNLEIYMSPESVKTLKLVYCLVTRYIVCFQETHNGWAHLYFSYFGMFAPCNLLTRKSIFYADICRRNNYWWISGKIQEKVKTIINGIKNIKSLKLMVELVKQKI